VGVDGSPDPVAADAPGSVWGRSELVRAGSLVRRPPVTCDPATPIADAAATMARERVSSILVPHAGGLGIVTDRDLRSRVLAERRDVAGPVSDVMTPNARTIHSDAMVGEVLLTMLEGAVHHLPVIGADGTLVGVVTDTDVMELGRDSPFVLKREIDSSADADAAIEAAHTLPRVVASMARAGVDPVDVGYAVALMRDALTRRFLALSADDFGPAPVPWGWLALGSEARREQGLQSDQDHAIAYAPGSDDAVDRYFANVAERVTANLEASGIPRCRGGVMATEPELRRPLDRWVEAFRAWMADLGTVGSLQGTILFDLRQVGGDLAAEPALDDVLREAPHVPGFAAHLARRALDERPPLGLGGRLKLERRGDHAGTIDVKRRGLLLITSIARALAIPRGLTDKSTLGRLRGLVDVGALTAADAADLEEAFRFLWGIRLRHQVDQAQRGERPDDHIDPRTLSRVTRHALREALRVIERSQRLLSLELPGHAPIR
jgi:CBS domain-containing protein